MPRTTAGDVRTKILKAAEERLWRTGFKKTTIDEIAADAGVGKGTVYLYFDSKEDIALAMIAQYKISSLEIVQAIARDPSKTAEQKLTEMLLEPAIRAFERCAATPHAQEFVAEVKPQLQTRMRPYLEHEIALLAEVVEEGNRQGRFAVDNTMQTARSLKYMCMGFLPPYFLRMDAQEIRQEIIHIVKLAVHGLRKCGEEESKT
jgi:TetR/AcrR family fatty acid metabolism transcriptional regulator